jgi:hypothetical protein
MFQRFFDSRTKTRKSQKLPLSYHRKSDLQPTVTADAESPQQGQRLLPAEGFCAELR